MKKTLLILLGLLLVTSMFADFTWMQLNLYEGIGVSQPTSYPNGVPEGRIEHLCSDRQRWGVDVEACRKRHVAVACGNC